MLAKRAEHANLGAQADRVVQVLAQLPQFASYASAREVAERAGVNVSTVVRTAQQLEFDGWSDLRRALRSEYLESLVTANPDRAVSTDAAARMLRQDAVNLAAAASADNISAIKSVAEAIHAARRTVVLATGTGAGPGHILSYLASIYGYDIQLAAGPATSQAVTVSQLDERDCLIVINVWRLTRALRGLARLGRERGATVAVLTDLNSSPLSVSADHVVITPIEGIDATPSLTAMVSVVHALLAQLGSLPMPSSVGRAEQAWEALDLMDDQA
jgi:DNA-binding MurR/RpiR family transcriptional regulator